MRLNMRIVFCVLSFFLISCAGCGPVHQEENPVLVSLDVVFSQDMRIDPNENIIVEGNTAYLTSRYDEQVYAYDLGNHQLLWACVDPFFGDTLPYIMDQDILISPDSLYVFMQGAPCMARIDKSTGTALGLYFFEGMDECITKSDNRVFKDGIITIGVYDYALIQMDPTAAVKYHSGPDLYDQPFLSMAKLEPYHHGSFLCWPIDNSVIISPYTGEYNGRPILRGDICRIDLTTKEVQWRLKDHLTATSPILINNKKFYTTSLNYETQSREFLIIDIDTGEIIKQIPGLAAPDCAPVVSGDRVFVISAASMSGNPREWEGIDSIYCFSASTDEILWTRPVKEDEVYGDQPQENRGILYVPCVDRIKLFDAATGEYIGYDDSLKGDHWLMGNSIKYGDTMLLSDGARFYGFKMNYVRGENGLEKIHE